MSPSLVAFYTNWSQKANAIVSNELAAVYDKYITRFVIYNCLYNQVTERLHASGFPLPKKIYDNKAATENVVSFLGPDNLIAQLHGNQNDIEAIINLIDAENFYIILRYGERQRPEDLKLLAELREGNDQKRAIAILKVAYHVRCNIFHGHKDYREYQRELIEPLTRIITKVSQVLYEALL